MEQQLDVALFIDLAHIRFGFLGAYGREPDPQYLMRRAREHGPVAAAYAYADFGGHPAGLRRELEIAGITPVDVVCRGPDAQHGCGAQMAMLTDIVECLLDRPYVNTLLLITGDAGFVRIATRARNRFGKKVVVAGVPGRLPNDLVESADQCDFLGDGQPAAPEPVTTADDDERRLLQLIMWLDQNRPYMTFGFIRAHAVSPHHALGFSEARATELLTSFKERRVLLEGELAGDDGRTLRTLELNATHQVVEETAKLTPPGFRDRPDAADGSSPSGEAPPETA